MKSIYLETEKYMREAAVVVWIMPSMVCYELPFDPIELSYSESSSLVAVAAFSIVFALRSIF